MSEDKEHKPPVWDDIIMQDGQKLEGSGFGAWVENGVWIIGCLVCENTRKQKDSDEPCSNCSGDITNDD